MPIFLEGVCRSGEARRVVLEQPRQIVPAGILRVEGIFGHRGSIVSGCEWSLSPDFSECRVSRATAKGFPVLPLSQNVGPANGFRMDKASIPWNRLAQI